MSELAKPETGLSVEQMTRLLADPILACPEPVRKDVWKVWACYGHLFPSLMPLASSVGVWMRDRGLEANDAKKVLNQLTRPEMMSQFKFASDLMTYLGQSVSDVIRSRRAIEEQRYREAGERGEVRTPRRLVDKLIASLGEIPKGDLP